MNDLITGYRIVQLNNGTLFCITLLCTSEHQDYATAKSYWTRACMIDKIENVKTGDEVEAIDAWGLWGKTIHYEKGGCICGPKTFFCHSKEDLHDNGVFSKMNLTNDIRKFRPKFFLFVPRT